MEVLEFGRQLLFLSIFVGAAVLVLSVVGWTLKDRRLVAGARAGMFGLAATITFSAACLVYGFVSGQYDVEYVFNYSEKLLPPFFKFAGLWAGLDGSLLFWTMLLSLCGAIVAFQNRSANLHPTARRLEPYVYAVLAVVTMFFVYLCWSENPFQVFDESRKEGLAARFKVDLDAQGRLTDGAGLNPQLVNYWFVIHPPTLYFGFIAFTVPFAYAIAALVSGELGDGWIKIVRRWTMVAWLFLTSGIILGGLWAYRQLGWGGYWAWDPVENASFLPWCAGTAFLHSVMVQERRDMLKAWNVFLIILTFFLTIWATWMTRSGVVESVHAFAGGDIGVKFQWFMVAIGASGLFLLGLRWRDLKSRNQFDSLLSRESVFLLNNLVLIVILVCVLGLSFFSKITHDFLAHKQTLGIPTYNLIMTPAFAVLLFLTALGPGLGWVRTSGTALRRNFIKPALFSVVVVAALYTYWGVSGQLGAFSDVLVPYPEARHPTAFYPTGLFVGLCVFICATVWAELYRTVAARVRLRKESLMQASFNTVVRNNRRWGGYLVHVGIAVLAFGIVWSSMFKIEKHLNLALGESAVVGPYRVTPTAEEEWDPEPGAPYRRLEASFRITRAASTLPTAYGSDAGEAGGGAVASAEAVADESVVAVLTPELRYYPKKNEWIKEVSIERRLHEDLYVYYAAKEPNGKFVLTVFVNPMMVLLYVGWFLMGAGGIFAALPIPGSKVGLVD